MPRSLRRIVAIFRSIREEPTAGTDGWHSIKELMFLIDSGDARNRFGLVIENLVGDVRRNTSRDIQKRTSAANREDANR